MRPAIFLDRDGVIIENRSNYVRSWADVSVYPQALTALAQISQSPYLFILVTNQSAVGRGIMSLETAWDINQRLVNVIIENGGRIDGVYMCPHTPLINCECRKPRPGLLLQAASELDIDLNQSFMIGDALTDLYAADAAGVSQAVLVRTGRGAAQEKLPEAVKLQPLMVYPNLSAALAAMPLIK